MEGDIHQKCAKDGIMISIMFDRRPFFTATAIAFLILLPLISACSSRPMNIKNVAKADIDLVADAHLQEVTRLLRKLTVKLYKRNPKELNKQSRQDIHRRLAQLFHKKGELRFPELDNKQGSKAMMLCFDDRFKGDRVFALMVGLTGMIRQSYNNQDEFFLFDSLDQQKLYNSARNIEILVWRLNNRRDSQGNLYILTNGQDGETANLSFERMFGKMIAIQDMMARITADRTNRAINRVVHTLATATFLPTGF